ncbi:MAG: amidohydrolase family protein [Verrucomicrobia bacterium]|nr:amidohydrolase family protein [Verrucomicrobiota bacterium]
MKTNRRDFLKCAGTGLGALGLATVAQGQTAKGAAATARASGQMRAGEVGLPTGWRTMRKFDAHNHVFAPVNRPNADWSEVEAMIEAADSLGIAKLLCSKPITAGAMVGIETVRDANDAVIAAMKRYPARVAGYCFVQPGNGAAALDEIERCLAAGMIGVKLYNQFKFTDPVLVPIVEKCLQRKILFLGHSGHVTDARTQQAQPKISDTADFCVLARRYPELMLILGHIQGGGDWEWSIKGLRDFPNIYVDTSGSVLEADAIGRCVREVGAGRILFATDQTMEGGVGKILSAELTAEQRENIFWRNLQRLLDRRTP